MTAARVERTENDAWGARAFLEQARLLAADGCRSGNSPEGRQLLLHAAVIAACDAVLAVNGRMITGSDGGHGLRLSTAQALLPGDLDELFDRLDDSRMDRNNISYAAAPVSQPAVEEAAEAVNRLLSIVDAHVSPNLPPYLT